MEQNLVSSHARRSLKRSAVACRMCRESKIRCNVTQSGPPCFNCIQGHTDCAIPSRKKRSRARTQKSSTSLNTSEKNPRAQRLPSDPTRQATALLESPGSSSRTHSLWPSICPSSSAQHNTDRLLNPQIEGSSPYMDFEYVAVNDVAERSSAETEIGPLSLGAGQGLDSIVKAFGPILELKGGGLGPSQFNANQFSAGDLEFLHLKGVFDFPIPTVCEKILRSYFHYVHPLLPIMDVNCFLAQYEEGGPQNVNLLLLWSMFLAAANFIDAEALVEAGYSSRKAMKLAMYQRAKALFDIADEGDQLLLVQSALLMGFWCSEARSRTSCWYWLGIAISLYQCTLPHRHLETDEGHRNCIPGVDRCRLWSVIWWNCCIREVWLSLALGRPMRINIENSNTPMLSAADVQLLVEDIPRHTLEKYLPEGMDILSRTWCHLVGLSHALGCVLSVRSRAKAIEVSRDDLEKREYELRMHYRRCRDENHNGNRTVLLHLHLMELYSEAAIILLYQPYGLQNAGDDSAIQQDDWRASTTQKVRSAISNCNAVLDKMIMADMINVSPVMMIWALLPVLQQHILQSVSPKPLARRIGLNRLDLCMVVIQELQGTYWSADFLFKLVSKVQKKLETTTVDRFDMSRRNLEIQGLTSGAGEFAIGDWIWYLDARVNLDAYNTKDGDMSVRTQLVFN